MPSIKYYQFDNLENEKRARQLIEPLLDFFPAWVLEVDVVAQAYEHTEYLMIYLTPRYKRVYFNFGPVFWTADLEHQRADIVHEFFHAVLGELVDWMQRSVLNPMKEKDEAVFDVLDREFTDRSERVTQELAHLFGRLLGDATYGIRAIPPRGAFKITDTTQDKDQDAISREKGGTKP